MSERYKKEIEEILEQAGGLSTSRDDRRSRQSLWKLIRVQISQSLGGGIWSISPGRLMLTAMSLLFGALIVQSFAPGIVGLFFWTGLVLFLVAYGMFFIRPSKVEKRWRGQRIEYDRKSWWKRFRDKG